MSIIFGYGEPLKHCVLPVTVFEKLAQFDAEKASGMLTSILVRQLGCSPEFIVNDIGTRKPMQLETIIRDAAQYHQDMFYIVDKSNRAPKPTTATTPFRIDENETSAAATSSSASSSAPTDAAKSAPAAQNPSSSIFSLRLPNNTHRQVYLSELSDLVELRAYTQRIPLELLWEMLNTVLQSAAKQSSTGALSREALVALLHALISHIGEKEPELFPAALRPAPGKPFAIPSSVTASIVRLHELVMYDAQNIQERDDASVQAKLDQQQVILVLILLSQGQVWEQLYLGFTLFADATDEEDGEKQQGPEEEEDDKEETLTRPQFLRFLRACLFPSVLTLTKRYTVPTVMEWISCTCSFVANNLQQLFDLKDTDGKPARISFAHLLQFHQSFPNILAFLTIGDRIESRMAAHVAAMQQRGPKSSASKRAKLPPVSTGKRRGANNRQPLSPLHESPEEAEYSSDQQADSDEVDDEEEEEEDEEDEEDAEDESAQESNDAGESDDAPDSPLFSFAGSNQPSVVRQSSQQSSSSDESALPTPANSRAVSGASPELRMLQPSRSVSSSPSEGIAAPPNSRSLSAMSNGSSSTGSYHVPPNSRNTSASPGPDVNAAVLINPHTREVLHLDPSHVHMLRTVYSALDLTVSGLLVHLQAFEKQAEIDRPSFERAVHAILDASPVVVKDASRKAILSHLLAIFEVFQISEDNAADVIELAVGLSSLCRKSGPEEVYRFAFTLFDSDSDSRLTQEELHDLFTSILRPLLPDAEATTQRFLRDLLGVWVPALFRKALAKDPEPQQQTEEEQSISYTAYRDIIQEYTAQIDFLGIIDRLLDPRATLFGAPKTSPASSNLTSPTSQERQRKRWDLSSPVVPEIHRIVNSSEDEWPEGESQDEEPQPSDSGSDLDQYIDPKAKAAFQARHHFPTYDEYAAAKHAAIRAEQAIAQTRAKRSARILREAAQASEESGNEITSTESSPSHSPSRSHPHKRLKTDSSPSSQNANLKNPAFQLGLWRTFMRQQEALRVIHQVHSPTGQQSALQSRAQPAAQRSTGASSAPAATPSKQQASSKPFSSPSTNGVPSLSFASLSVPAVAEKPNEFAKWADAVTPRKQRRPEREEEDEDEQEEEEDDVPTRVRTLPRQPVTITLFSAKDAESSGFPQTLEFSVMDLQRVHHLLILLKSLAPTQREYAFLSPASVIMKVLEPCIILSSGGGAEEDGTPLVSAEDFHRGLSFLMSTAAEAQQVEVDEQMIDHLLACLFVSYQSPAVEINADGDAIEVIRIQDFLLAITVWCDRRWNGALRMVDASNSGRINEQQLKHLFSCCIRLLFGVHEGLKQHLGASGFNDLIERVAQASVTSFFPMADSSQTGSITIADFNRVRLRYPNLLDWSHLLQELQRGASNGTEREDGADSQNTSVNQSREILDSSDDEAYLEDSRLGSPIASDVEESDPDDDAAPVLSVDLRPSLPEEVLAQYPEAATALNSSPLEWILNMQESDLYHLFFLRSLAVSLDPVTLIQTILVVEQQALSHEDIEGLNHQEYNRVMSHLFPVDLLPKAYHRLLSSILNQLFLILSFRTGSNSIPRVHTRHLIVACHSLLPGSHETNMKYAFEFLSAVTSGTENGGCVRRQDVIEFVECSLKVLLTVSASTFRFSASSNTISLRPGTQQRIQRVASEAAGLLFGLANVRLVEPSSAAIEEGRLRKNQQEEALSYSEFSRIYSTHPTILPWLEALDGLIEGEMISNEAKAQAAMNDSMESGEINEEGENAEENASFDAEVKAYEDAQRGAGYQQLTDQEYDSDANGYSPYDSGSESPQLSDTEIAQLEAAFRRPRGGSTTSSLAASTGSPPLPQNDARRLFFDHWKQLAGVESAGQIEAFERLASQADLSTRQHRQPQLKPGGFSAKVGSTAASAGSSRRSSTSSSSSTSSTRRHARRAATAARKKKSRAGPHTLSTDPFSVVLATAENPSPRAIMSAVKVKPLPVFQLHSSAPKLLLCIPMHADASGGGSKIFEFASSTHQSLKVYDQDLPAFTFFKNAMKHIDSEGLYSFIVNTARGDDSSHLDDEEVLKSERFSRVEFAACLKALLFGSTQGSPVAGPSENAFQQLQQFQIQIFRQLDHQSRGSVSVLEVLLALSLFLDRSPDEKLSLAFGILDFESSSSITEESLRIFFRASYSLLTALCTTANRTSVPSQPGSPLAPNSGPLSPSSLHSLPHEAIQARLASTAVHGAQEVMKLAGTKEKGRITFDEFARVTESHKPLFSFIHVFDLDDTFSPKAVDSAEATHRQSRFSDAMASASSGEEAQYSPRLSDESEEEEIIAPNSQGRAAALERQRQAAAAASSSSSRPAPRVNNFTSSLPGGSPSTFTDGPYSQMFQRR